ncbi:MAG TPA: pyrrolo-quinoline quinone, partial [Anaeromyxobacteraceae bacterium]
AVDPDGTVAWTVAPSLGRGPPQLAPAGALLLARALDGSCDALARDGRTRWSALAPRGPAAAEPRVARRVVILPGDPTLALDAASGAPLGALPLPPPARLLCDGELGVAALDAEGLLALARLAGRMGVVGDEG